MESRIASAPLQSLRAQRKPSTACEAQVDDGDSLTASSAIITAETASCRAVASVSRPFCGSCDRVRLTADGQIRNCLFAREESDLRSALRGGADDAEIARRIQVSIAGKKAGHGIDDPTFLQPDRPMSAIGG